jgi:hypothetical protein
MSATDASAPPHAPAPPRPDLATPKSSPGLVVILSHGHLTKSRIIMIATTSGA